MTDYPSPGPVSSTLLASPPEPPAPQPSADGLDWLRALDWRQFEQLVGQAYQLQGYEVLPTAYGADGGMDLILTRGNERIFVQCKHWRSQQVGVQVVRELYGLVAAHQATWGIVATSGRFTIEAKQFARQARMTLLDGPAVAQLIAIGRAGDAPEGPAFNHPSPVPPPPSVHSDNPSCPICRAPMVLRRARRGPEAGSQFWGCSAYPGCKGVRPAVQQSAAKKASTVMPKLIARLVVPLIGVAVIFAGVQISLSMLRGSIAASTGEKPAAVVGNQPAGVAFGEQPMDVAVDSAHNQIFTANYISGDVTVATATTLTPTRTIAVRGKPIGIATDSHGRIFVADGSAKRVQVIDLKSGKTTRTLSPKGRPTDLALDAARQRLYVVTKAGTLESFNTATGARVGSKQIGGSPSSVTVDTSSHTVYVGGQAVTAYNAFTLAYRSTPFVFSGGGLALDSTTTRLYQAHGNTLVENNLVTGRTRRWSTDAGLSAVSIDAKHRIAYLLFPDTNRVQAISIT